MDLSPGPFVAEKLIYLFGHLVSNSIQEAICPSIWA